MQQATGAQLIFAPIFYALNMALRKETIIILFDAFIRVVKTITVYRYFATDWTTEEIICLNFLQWQ